MRLNKLNYLLFGFSVTLSIVCFLFGYHMQSLNIKDTNFILENINTHSTQVQLTEKFNFQNILNNNLNVVARLLLGGYILGIPRLPR